MLCRGEEQALAAFLLDELPMLNNHVSDFDHHQTDVDASGFYNELFTGYGLCILNRDTALPRR